MNSQQFVFELPECACRLVGKWQFEDAIPNDDCVETYWKCASCDRPAVYIRHAGGNALIIPRRRIANIPFDVRNYISDVIMRLFCRNARVLHELRGDYEQRRRRMICFKLGIPAHLRLNELSHETRTLHDISIASIFTENGWLEPAGFDAAPLPPKTDNAFVYVLSPYYRNNPFGKYWNVIT